MNKLVLLSAVAIVALSPAAFADSTGFMGVATGFTLPNAQQAVSAASAQTAGYATIAGSAGFATNAGAAASALTATTAGFATSAGSAKTATSATSAASADYATSAGTAAEAAGLTANRSCAAGSALSVTKGILGCVSSVTSISGNLNGSQIVGSITNASGIDIAGNIVSNTGYVYGTGGLFTDAAVYSNSYDGRWGGSNATFNGNAATATSTSYAANSDIGILHQHGPGGDGSSFYCDTGYRLVPYDLNVGSTNNAFFYECIQNGH